MIGDPLLILLNNPIVLGSVLGILVALTEWSMPLYLDNLLSMVSQTAGPVALISIGLSFIGLKINIKINELILLTLFKLIVFPLITFLIVTHVFEMETFWAESAILLSALPTGALVFVVCQKYDIYVKE